jgi:hypothetical protein
MTALGGTEGVVLYQVVPFYIETEHTGVDITRYLYLYSSVVVIRTVVLTVLPVLCS